MFRTNSEPAKFARLTEADTGETVYINPRLVCMVIKDPRLPLAVNRHENRLAISIVFDRDHSISVSENLDAVMKALDEASR